MRVTISSTPRRKKPQEGDRKTVNGVEYVRVISRVKDGPHAGAHIVSNGRPCFEWVPVEVERMEKPE